MSLHMPQINATAPKISQENIAYMISLTALCFSISVWSNACCCVQILLLGATIIFGGLVVYSVIVNKGTNHDRTTR